MNCERWRELASDYIEGTLTSRDIEAAMRAHLEKCSACQADEQALRALWHEMNVLPTVEPPLFFRDNLIAKIQAQEDAKPSFWQKFFPVLPGIGRLAIGTTLAVGLGAALLWYTVIPRNTADKSRTAGVTGGLLPGKTTESNTEQTNPYLRISRTITVLEDYGPAYDFTVTLEKADKGTARFELAPAKTPYRFTLTGNSPQVLRIPFTAIPAGSETMDLSVHWTGNGNTYTKRLFVPIPQEDGVPARTQTFRRPGLTVATFAQEVAARYDVPVTLEDVPTEQQIEPIVENATAEQALRQTLEPLGLRVRVSSAGILVEKKPVETAQPTARP